MSRATRIGSALAGLVMAAGMMVHAPVAHAENAQVIVSDGVFSPPNVEVVQGDVVVFDLAADATLRHSVTVPGLFDQEFGPTDPKPQQRITLPTQNLTPDTYSYGCKFHYQQGMVGQIVVRPASTDTSSSTTTTTTAPPTTTTTAPATTTTTPPTSATTTPTTRPATTSTTRPAGTTTAPTVATTATTAPKPSVQGASEPTTPTTKKKSTTTTAKKKKATPSTVKVEETTTTTTMMPSLAAALPSGQGETPTPASEDLPDATEAGEEAASWVGDEKGGKSGGGMLLLFGLGGIGALGLGGAAWGWYHRSSRYLSA